MSDAKVKAQNPVIKEVPLKMLLNLNIPGQVEPLTFSNSMFTSDSISKTGFAEYPFFSSEILYPKSVLKELPYQEQVNFFFKKSDFLKLLMETDSYNDKAQTYLKRKKILDEAYKKYTQSSKEAKPKAFENYSTLLASEKKKKHDPERNSICRRNIMLMLLLLFPVKTYDTTINTYDSRFLHTASSTFSISTIMPLLLSIFAGIKDTSDKYAYLTIPGKGVCTISHIVWVNDIYNHPEYKTLTSSYAKYTEWKVTESITQRSKMKENFDKFIKKYSVALGIIGRDVVLSGRNNMRNIDNLLKQIKQNASQLSQTTTFDEKAGKTAEIFITSINSLSYNNSISVREIEHLVLQQDVKRFSLRELIRELQQVTNIYEIVDYIENPSEIPSDSSDENDRAKVQRINQWSGSKKLNEFKELLIRLKSRESSNVFLQTSIEQFITPEKHLIMIDGVEVPELEKLMSPEESKNVEYIKSVDTGVSLSKESGASIYLQVDIIQGKVDDTNKAKIACIFNGEYLGNELETLLKPSKEFWKLPDRRFYFNMNDETASVVDENKNEVKSTDTVPKETPIKNKKSGGYTKKKRRNRSRK